MVKCRIHRYEKKRRRLEIPKKNGRYEKKRKDGLQTMLMLCLVNRQVVFSCVRGIAARMQIRLVLMLAA